MYVPMLQGFSVVDHSSLTEIGCNLPQSGGPVVHFNLLGAQGADPIISNQIENNIK